MSIGRFLGGIGALLRHPDENKYLLLRRSSQKDYGAGHWECVTGRVDQGEGFPEALHREVMEELNIRITVDFIIGTSHFYRGAAISENELIGVVYCCTPISLDGLRISAEHSEMGWYTAAEAATFLPPDQWLMNSIAHAEFITAHMPSTLQQYYRDTGFDTSK